MNKTEENKMKWTMNDEMINCLYFDIDDKLRFYWLKIRWTDVGHSEVYLWLKIPNIDYWFLLILCSTFYSLMIYKNIQLYAKKRKSFWILLPKTSIFVNVCSLKFWSALLQPQTKKMKFRSNMMAAIIWIINSRHWRNNNLQIKTS